MRTFWKFLIESQYALINELILLCWKGLFNPYERSIDYQTILIVRKGTLGDHICSLPAIAEVKKQFPDSRLFVLIQSSGNAQISLAAIVEKGIVDEIIDMHDSSPLEVIKLLKKRNIDLVIEIPQNVDTLYTQVRNMIVFRLAGIETGIGWGVSQTMFLKKKQLELMQFPNEQERIAQNLGKYGFKLSEYVYPVQRSFVDYPFFANDKSKIIAVAIGANRSKNKWPIEFYKTVVEYLIMHRYQVIMIGDAEDAAVIAKCNISGVVNLAGKLTVAQSAAVLSKCMLTISNDSGPMHLSYAVHTPVVAIFSARNYPGKWMPPNTILNKVLVNYDVPCAVCLNQQCFNDYKCIQSITPESVIREVEELIQNVTHASFF